MPLQIEVPCRLPSSRGALRMHGQEAGMPRELVAVAVRTPVLREYADEPPRAGEIRVHTLYSAPKHGTELHIYRGDQLPDGHHWDEAQRLVLRREAAGSDFPQPLGNIPVGLVTEVGAGVEGVP